LSGSRCRRECRQYPDHGPRDRIRGLLAVDVLQRANGEPVPVNTITAVRGKDASRRRILAAILTTMDRRSMVQSGVVEKQPWYEPSEKLSAEPIINSSMPEEFDTVVVEGANKWAVAAE
jgi:hypothetical protein